MSKESKKSPPKRDQSPRPKSEPPSKIPKLDSRLHMVRRLGGAPVPPLPASGDSGPLPARILFDRNSSEVRPFYRDIIGKHAQLVRRIGTSVVILSGHANPRERAAEAQALSSRRADAVASLLREFGVPERKIVTMAYGAKAAFTLKGDSKSEILNRCVVIHHGQAVPMAMPRRPRRLPPVGARAALAAA